MFKVTNFMIVGQKIIIEFNGTQHRVFDFYNKYQTETGSVIRELIEDTAKFHKVHIREDDSTLEWENGFDLDPGVLYQM